MNKTRYLGLDVHKEKAAIAHTQEGSCEESVDRGKYAASVQSDERVHHYQRGRASLTGSMVELRKIIETKRLVGVARTRLVRISLCLFS